MDVFWMRQGGIDPTHILQKYLDLFLSLHLKDCKKIIQCSKDGRADFEANIVLGIGDVGIVSVIAEARNQRADISLSNMNHLG